MALIKLAYADTKQSQKLSTTATLNQQLLALIGNNLEEKSTIKVTSSKVNALMKEIRNMPNRPKSSGAQKIQTATNKELFNSTVPIKFFNANLDDSGMRESIISSAIQGLHGGVPAKHNLLANSMRLNSS